MGRLGYSCPGHLEGRVKIVLVLLGQGEGGLRPGYL